MRTATTRRTTKETDVTVTLNLDGTGVSDIKTGIGFLDHMLDQVARHGLMDLKVAATGDLHIDMHHTTEDVGITLGQVFKMALGDMRGITRFADVTTPMDETLSRVALDISGRPYMVWRVELTKPKIGEMDTELFKEFFQAFAQHAGITLHIENFYGDNAHHIVESCFKGLGRALRQAVSIDARSAHMIPSTKGSL